MFHFVCLERLEERYTAQMYDWVVRDLLDHRIPFDVIEGEPLVSVTEGGQFLHWASRVHYASTQVAKISSMFHDGEVRDGDVFFIADLWHPGFEAIAYLADLMGVDVRIYAINYAGPFDPSDLVHCLLPWGQYQEATWYAICDKVFVGSQFHKDLLLRGLRKAGLPEFENIVVTGLVWNPADVVEKASNGVLHGDDCPIVLWPHRLSPDKAPEEFYALVEELAPHYPDVRWVVSSSRSGQEYAPPHPAVEFISQPKSDYYAMMRKAVVMVSTAYHENFGYTVHEATALNTPVLCPRRADYPEMILSTQNLYNTHKEAVAKIERALNGDLPVAKLKLSGGFVQMLCEMGLAEQPGPADSLSRPAVLGDLPLVE